MIFYPVKSHSPFSSFASLKFSKTIEFYFALAAPLRGRSFSVLFAAMDGIPRARAKSRLAITVEVSGRGLNLGAFKGHVAIEL
jgi:hypothetical protein